MCGKSQSLTVLQSSHQASIGQDVTESPHPQSPAILTSQVESETQVVTWSAYFRAVGSSNPTIPTRAVVQESPCPPAYQPRNGLDSA
jgi:hypothetical protein